MKRIVYPGSFDPFTMGHLNIVKRAAKVFDEVIILVSHNPQKNHFLLPEERINLIKQVIKDEKLSNVRVDICDNLTTSYCKNNKINLLLRGIRQNCDLADEEELSFYNLLLTPEIETFYLLTDNRYRLISSSKVRELFGLGIVKSEILPTAVANYLLNKLYQR